MNNSDFSDKYEKFFKVYLLNPKIQFGVEQLNNYKPDRSLHRSFVI